MRPLPYPPEAEKNEDSLELLRCWIVNGELQVVLTPWVWEDEPEEWGRLLAESACHLADSISKETKKDRDTIFQKISESLIFHLNNPPTDLEGEHLD